MKGPTQQYSDTIKSLQSRIQALEDENRLLKERLEEAGVSYANIVSGDAEGVVELYDPDQGARIKKFDVTDKIASDFFMMFCRGRKDVYDLRYTNPKTGKNGYYSQCFNRWGLFIIFFPTALPLSTGIFAAEERRRNGAV